MMDLEIVDPSNKRTYIVKTSKEYYDTIQSNDEIKQEFLTQLFHKKTAKTENDEEGPEKNESPKKKLWSYSETTALIGLVQDFETELDIPRERKFMWTQISKLMQENKINVTFQECMKKWQNLVRTYKHVKKNRGKSKRFSFYKQLDEILGDTQRFSSPEPINEITSNVVESENEVVIEAVDSKKRKLDKSPDYFQLKNEHIQAKLEHLKYKKESRMRMEQMLDRKLDLEERKVVALENLVCLKQNSFL